MVPPHRANCGKCMTNALCISRRLFLLEPEIVDTVDQEQCVIILTRACYLHVKILFLIVNYAKQFAEIVELHNVALKTLIFA